MIKPLTEEKIVRICCKCKAITGCTIYENGELVKWNCGLCVESCEAKGHGIYDNHNNLCKCTEIIIEGIDGQPIHKVMN